MLLLWLEPFEVIIFDTCVVHLIDLLDGTVQWWWPFWDQQRHTWSSPRLDHGVLVQQISVSSRLHIEYELRLQAFFAPQIPSRERMVIEHICDQPHIFTKYGDIPFQESHFAITEHLHVIPSLAALEPSIVFIDSSPQLLHRLWLVRVHILEFLTCGNRGLLTLDTRVFVLIPHISLSFFYILLKLGNFLRVFGLI